MLPNIITPEGVKKTLFGQKVTVLGVLGDVNPFQHGGSAVLKEGDELRIILINACDQEGQPTLVWDFTTEPNWREEWWAKDEKSISSFRGRALGPDLDSNLWYERAQGWLDVQQYWGIAGEPSELSEKMAEKKYGHLWGG